MKVYSEAVQGGKGRNVVGINYETKEVLERGNNQERKYFSDEWMLAITTTVKLKDMLPEPSCQKNTPVWIRSQFFFWGGLTGSPTPTLCSTSPSCHPLSGHPHWFLNYYRWQTIVYEVLKYNYGGENVSSSRATKKFRGWIKVIWGLFPHMYSHTIWQATWCWCTAASLCEQTRHNKHGCSGAQATVVLNQTQNGGNQHARCLWGRNVDTAD